MGVIRYLSVILSLAALVKGQGDPECLCLEEVETVRDFRNPLVIKNSGDGSDRLFVGKIYVRSAQDHISHNLQGMNKSAFFKIEPRQIDPLKVQPSAKQPQG